MTQEEFVRNLKLAVLDPVVDETISQFLNPPGRRPDLSNQSTANWYRSLPEEDQQHAERLAKSCADSVFFGILAVLDNLRSIEGIGDKGSLQLAFEKNGESTLLNAPKDENLHDIFHRLKA